MSLKRYKTWMELHGIKEFLGGYDQGDVSRVIA